MWLWKFSHNVFHTKYIAVIKIQFVIQGIFSVMNCNELLKQIQIWVPTCLQTFSTISSEILSQSEQLCSFQTQRSIA